MMGVAAIGTAAPAVATPTTVYVNNLQPNWAAPGVGGVYSAYYGPTNGYGPVSPGTTAVFDGREAGIIKAGIDPYAPGLFDDEGLFAFKPISWPGVMYIESLESGALEYDVENQSGANPVWITFELEIGDSDTRGDNAAYQYVPPTNPAAWHTVDAAAASTWREWTTYQSGITTGPALTISDIADDHPGAQVIRAYLRLGMGDSYGDPVPTIGWVDKITIGEVTFDFETTCTTTCYVDEVTGNDSNTGESPAEAFATIQRGIDVVSSAGTVIVASGSYVENVLIDKPVTLTGAGELTTTVMPAVTNPVCSPSSLCGGAASNVMLVEADDVTISGFTIEGDNPSLTSGVVAGGADLDARNGIITNHLAGTFNNMEIHDVTVQDIYLRGIYASSGGTFDIHDNTVTNVQADPSSIALFNYGGGGTFADNTVSDANDAIASNHSNGTSYTGNVVTSSFSGIHTDNAGDAGGTPDLIQGNTVSSCQIDGYGIWVFVPYIAPTVTENSVAGCTVGLGAFGGAFSPSPTVTTSFTKNTADGTGATSSGTNLGFWIDTTTWYWGETSVAVSAANNFIQDFDTGVAVIENGGFTAAVDLSNSSITGNVIGIDDTTTATDPDLTSNWWGDITGPANAVLNPAGLGDSVGTGTTFRTWLCSGTDTAPATPGFQPTGALCPSVSFGADQETVETNSGTHTVAVPITLSQADMVNPTTVNWKTVDGTAKSGANDYLAVASGVTTFAPGSTSETVLVTVKGDTKLEKYESFSVHITGVSANASVGDSTASITILNDEKPKVAVTGSKITEGGPAKFTIKLKQQYYLPLALSFSTVDGTATVAAGDYTPLAGYGVVIPAGTFGGAIVNVNTLIDGLTEVEETVKGTVTGGKAPATGTSRIKANVT